MGMGIAGGAGMRIAFAVLLALHGAIHLLGFVKAFGLAEVAQIQQPVSRLAGVLWLFSTVAFLAATGLLVASSRWWWVAGAPAVLSSQALVLMAWSDAKFGTLPNVVALLPLAAALLDLRPSSSPSTYRREVERGLARTAPAAAAPPVVTEADLAPLPAPVQAYLRRAGVVGRPRVLDMHVRLRGEMRNGHDGGWMTIHVDQHSFFDQPTRLFLLDASLYGIPFDALHAYTGESASMRVRVGSLVEVVNARGPQMHRSETVTFFNDMCLLAPATLLDPRVSWRPIDDHRVTGVFSHGGDTISADLTFDESGDLVGFVSRDRLQSDDGKTFASYPWSTPVLDHRDFGPARVIHHAEALWQEPKGDFTYARFELEEIAYNVARP